MWEKGTILKKHIPSRFAVIYNSTRFQHEKSENCAKYTVYFIFHAFYNLDLPVEDVLNSIFSKCTIKNETKILNFFDNIQPQNESQRS